MKNDTILICNISGFFKKKTHIDIEKVGLSDIVFGTHRDKIFYSI